VGQGEGNALVVEDPRSTLLALERPSDRLVQEPPHRSAAPRGDAEALLRKPRTLQLVAAADVADDVVRRQLDIGEADRGVALRIVMREGRVVRDRNAGPIAVDDD